MHACRNWLHQVSLYTRTSTGLMGMIEEMVTVLMMTMACSWAADTSSVLPAGGTPGACSTAMDCALNGDCVSGRCACDPAWSGAENCAVMSFAPVEKAPGKAPGYYNHTESSWGGFPIQGDDGKWNLIHAQMANHCPLGSWTSNSIVARSVSTTGSPDGPYAFAEELLPPFAHNPSVRKAPDGTYVIFFIGGWKTNASTCVGGEQVAAGSPASLSPADNNCTTAATIDPPNSIRVGGDYKSVTLSAGASIADCATSCCADPHCEAFSFNNQTGAPPVCKHKAGSVQLKQHTCPCCAAGSSVPGCSSGKLSRTPAPQCNGRTWPKTCGSKIPGPQEDCCGPASEGLNAGCGIAVATSKSLSGPWDVQPLKITNQWESDDVYCAHTNPSVQLLKNGTAVMAFNAGYGSVLAVVR
eukprot:COSAG03_NODE_2588_length_2615_cov_7.356518_3_plen_412_part_00